MVKASEAMSARARARQAKAVLDEQRAEQDRQIVDAATQFYEAVEALETARAAAAAAENAQTTAVKNLADLGQSEEQIATLCGIGSKEVRELRRRVASKKPGSPPSSRAKASMSARAGQSAAADQDVAVDGQSSAAA